MRELLALLFLGRKVQSEILRQFILSGQSEILRFAQNDSEGLRMTARQTGAKKTRQVLLNDSMIRSINESIEIEPLIH